SHASTLKSPSYTKSVSWQHYLIFRINPFFVSNLIASLVWSGNSYTS
ncbi:transposase, partial [Shigella flexneri]